jgi:cell division protease FtsH
MAREIDREITRFVTENYERAKRTLTNQMPRLKALAELLLEKEVLDALDIDHIILQTAPALNGSVLTDTAHAC